MAYNPEQIVKLVRSGSGPRDLFSGSDQSAQMANLHTEIAADMQRLQAGMENHWVGDAAGKAYLGAGPMVQASDVSGEHLTQATNLYMGQGSSFGDLTSKVAEVGDLGERPSDDWVSNTPLSFMSNRKSQIDEWNEKAGKVTEAYGLYHGQSSDNSGRWPQQYGQLGLPEGSNDIQYGKPDDPGQPGGPGHPGGPGGHVKGGSGGSPVVGGGAPSHSGGGPVQPGPSSPPDDQTRTTGTTPTDHAVPPPGGKYVTQIPPPPVPTPNPGYDTPWGPGPVGPGPGGFGPGSGTGAREGGGYGSRGPGAGGPGSGALGGGKGTGVGGVGEPHSAGGRVSGSAGATGRPGASGMGPGATGRRGEGEEDLEHRSPAYLLEDDPDEALIGELPRTPPPVIGL